VVVEKIEGALAVDAVAALEVFDARAIGEAELRRRLDAVRARLEA
jgi:hypothetical protein